MANRKSHPATDEQAATPSQTYTVVVRLAFIADGQAIASTEAEGQLSVPAAGDTQLINIPLDARAFAEGFIPAITALAMQDATKEARANLGKPVAVNGPALVGADGTPLVGKQPNRATRRGHLTRVRD